MKKILYIFIVSVLFNCTNAQDNANEDSALQFDNNQAISNVSEEGLIFELEENALGTNSRTTQLLSPDRLFRESTNQNTSSKTVDLAGSQRTTGEDDTTQEERDRIAKGQTEQAESATAGLRSPRTPITTPTKTTQPVLPSPLSIGEIPAVNEKKLSYVKTLYNRGQYALLSQTVINNNEHEAQYYQALGNYNLVRKEPKYKGRLNPALIKERDALINTAKDNLFNVGVNSTNTTLKEKTVFWYGIISFTHPKNPKDEAELTDTFLYIEESMTGSNVYNDALVYLMMIYKKLGKTAKAKEYYKKILTTSPNDLVYNYRTDVLVPAKDLVRLYSDLK